MGYLAVAIGGAIGASLRYFLGNLASSSDLLKGNFPYATFAVNILGSFLIGVLYVLIVERAGLPSYWREILIVGFCGGFTTFSTFSLDAILLWQAGQVFNAILYVVLSVFFCIVAALVAIAAMRML